MQGTIWDVAIVGGGSSGMMAAGRAAELGARVILLEKNTILGKKLLLSGGGRCNFTNAEFDTRMFLSKFKEAGNFLFSPFSQFGVRDSIDFFTARGMETKIEENKRVFPASNKSASVRDTLAAYMKKGGVDIRLNTQVSRIEHDNARITALHLEHGEIIRAHAFIIATGGLSRPDTGSTGDGFKWLAEMGHTIITPDPSLVPIAIHDEWVKQLQGVTITNVKLTVISDNKKQFSRKGNVLFTHFGVSGPAIINMSKDVGALCKHGPVEIHIDLQPSLDHGSMNEKLQALFNANNNSAIKNIASELAPVTAMGHSVIKLSGIDPKKCCREITREERMRLIATIKGLPMHVERLLGADKAIITSGGVPLKEINMRTMQSLIKHNLYLTGDIFDIDRPSGGYSLQLCWTTGFVAGTHAAQFALAERTRV